MGRIIFTLALLGLLSPLPSPAGLSDGLVAYYPFEGNAGDATSNGNHGTSRGNPSYDPGFDGLGLSLDGFNDVIELPAFLMRDTFTVAFRVKTSASAPGDSGWFEGWGLVDGEVCGSPAGGDTGIAMIDGGRIIYRFEKGETDVNDGSWHAVVVTRNTSTGLIEMYVDGSLEADDTHNTDPITGMPWIGVGNNPCTSDAAGNGSWFSGMIDELRFYDRVLSSQEIAQLSGKGDFVPKLGNWFDFDNPGWGFDIQRVGDLLFVIWFTYLPDGTPVWYLAVGELDGMSWSGDLEFYKWDPFGQPGNQASVSVVGTISIDWIDEANASASWTLNGIPGGADISFAEFAGGPTLANLTGHYFPFFAPGWGFTLLTQGEVTVITMYFYRSGQPTWLQGVVTTPGFTGVGDMNAFFGPDLCPSCLGRKGSKTKPDVTLAARLRYEYTPGNPQEATLFVEDDFPDSPLGPNPFSDIFLGAVPRTGASITGAYQNFYVAGLDNGEEPPVSCISFQYRQNLMSENPTPTGALDTHYVTTERGPNGNFQVFNDPLCSDPHLWMSRFDGQMYQSWIQEAPTNEIDTDVWATQQKWFIVIPDALTFDSETCDLHEGIGTYGVKRIQRDGTGTISGFTMYGTGVTNYDLQRCTDMFSFNEFIYRQDPLPGNQEFLDNEEDLFMFSVQVTY